MATPVPYNYRDPNYASYMASQTKPAPAPGLDTSAGKTLVPEYSTNPPPGEDASLGRWVGNQWVHWGPNFPNPADAVAPPPEAKTNDTPPPQTGTSTLTGGTVIDKSPAAPAAAPAPPATTVSDTYRDLISQMLNTSGPSTTASTAGTAPVRQTSTLVAPTATTVPFTKLDLPPPSQFDTLVHDQILKMLGGPTAEEAGKAAANSIPVSAYRNSILRDLGVQQAGAAEQSGLTGTQGSGGMAGQQEALRQAAGEKTATFTGQYVDKAMADRRAELQNAMDMAQKQGNFEDQQALQAQITALDNQIRAQANANQQFNTQSSLYLGQLGNEEDRYKNDISLYGTNLDADIRHEANANQRYQTEVQKLLGMSDVDLRRYLGDIQNQTNRYGIDVGANTSRYTTDLNANTAANELNQKAMQDQINDILKSLGLM
jgi:hypothetical protein